VNVTATGYIQNGISAGGAVGVSNVCNMDQVYVTDDCQGNSNSISAAYSAGGLVGLANAAGLTVNNSYAIASISAYNAGGLLGLEYGTTTTISNSYANFTLVGTAKNAGELIGFVYIGNKDKASTFTNCYYVLQSNIPIIGNKEKLEHGVQPYALGAYPNFDPSVWKGDRLKIESLNCSANFQNLMLSSCNSSVGCVGSNTAITISNPNGLANSGLISIINQTITTNSSCSPTNKRDNTNTNTTSFSYQVVIANQNVIFSIPSFNFSLSLVCKNGQCTYSGSSLALVPSSASSVQFLLSLVVSLCLLNLI